MKLFLDTNIIMDFVKCREPFIYEALPLIQQGEKGIHQLFISDLTFVNVAYLSKKGLSLYQLYEMLEDVYSLFEVVSIGKQAIKMALDLKYTDFEDAVQYFSAKQANADCIITRNKKDFTFSDILVYTPAEFMENPFTE